MDAAKKRRCLVTGREEKIMTEPVIRRVNGEDPEIGDFIHREFVRYGEQNGVALNYDEFCFTAEDGDGRITGIITGRAYYNEVHIGDLIVAADHRRSGIGSRLVRTVEEAFRGRGYDVITLTTFGFQAPEFYKKMGYRFNESGKAHHDTFECVYMEKAFSQ